MNISRLMAVLASAALLGEKSPEFQRLLKEAGVTIAPDAARPVAP